MQTLPRSLDWPEPQSQQILNLCSTEQTKKHPSNHIGLASAPYDSVNIHTRPTNFSFQNRKQKPLTSNDATPKTEYFGNSVPRTVVRRGMPSQDSDNGSITPNMHVSQPSLSQVSFKTQEEETSNVPFWGPRIVPRDPGKPIHGVGEHRSLMARYQKLTKMRVVVNGTRLKVIECRNVYIISRESTKTVKEQLLQEASLAAIKNYPSGPSLMRDWLERLRESEDKLRPLEAELERLEDKLTLQEWELKEYEQKIYQRNPSSVVSLLDREEEASFDDDEISDANRIVQGARQERIEQDDSFLAKILARRTDANIVRGRLTELDHGHDVLLEQKEEGIDLDEESRAELRDYRHRYDKLRRELEVIERDISRMEAPFILGQFTTEDHDFSLAEVTRMTDAPFLSTTFGSSGFQILDIKYSSLNEKNYDSDGHTTNEDDRSNEYDDIEHLNRDISSDNGSRDHNPFSRQYAPYMLQLLLPDEDASPSLPAPWYRSLVALDQEADVLGKADYINAWLLDRLRRSPIEVRRLKSATDSAGLELDQLELRDLAIEWWFKDASGGDFDHACWEAGSTGLSAMTARSARLFRQTRSDPGSSYTLRPKIYLPGSKNLKHHDRPRPQSR